MLVYHERQVAGLCAVHCLNTLLQARRFNEIDLMEIAQRLDEEEHRHMAEFGYESTEFLKFMAESSGNVADDGNYSHQVIEKACEIWDVKLTSIMAPEMVHIFENLSAEQAYVCNLDSHWYTLRKINGKWFNTNSLLPVPQFVSDSFLGLMIKTLAEQGYTIFVARGSLSPCPTTTDGCMQVSIPANNVDLWASPISIPSDVSSSPPSSQPTQQQQHNQQDTTEDEELAMAIELSLSDG